MFEVIIYSMVVVWLFTASIFDIKTREVPDWLNFSLIAVGLSTRLIYSLVSWDYWVFIYGVIGLIIAFVIAIVMSYTKQWGDGDSKMLLGVGACLGFNYHFIIFDFSNWPMLIYFLVNSLIIGAFYGIIYAIGLGILHRKEFIIEFRKWDYKVFILPLIFIAVFSLFSFIFPKPFDFMLLSLVAAVGLGIYILFFIKIVEKACMYKHIKVGKLVPGDWTAEIVKRNDRLICNKKDVLDEKQIKLLKRFKVKSVLVKEGIPFVPSFFLGFIFSLIFGNILRWLI